MSHPARYLVLATDYDGTLACDGRVASDTLAALERYRSHGGRLLLVTGRTLPDLQSAFDGTAIFHKVVAENGAVIYDPATRRRRLLASAPDTKFLTALRARGVASLSVGDVIVGTVQPYDAIVHDTIRDLGLELHVIFNKGSVMVLPSGINKASGLRVALSEIGMSPHNVAGVGDGENDHALLELCGLAVAVNDAVPALIDHADLVTGCACGNGVIELIDRLTGPTNSLPLSRRHHVAIGTLQDTEVTLPPCGASVLVTGSSSDDASAFVGRLLPELVEQGYQFCVVDTTGRHAARRDALVFGGSAIMPRSSDVLRALGRPEANAVVSIGDVPAVDRRSSIARLLDEVASFSTTAGRPHWLVFDEAEDVLSEAARRSVTGFADRSNIVLVGSDPDRAASVFGDIDAVIAVGAVTPALVTWLATRGFRGAVTSLDPQAAMIWTAGQPDGIRFDLYPE